MDVDDLVTAAAATVVGRRSVSAFLIGTAPQWTRIARTFPEPAPRSYDRHILGNRDGVEVVLIHWGNRAETPAHGHPEGGCWLAVLGGRLIEEIPGTGRAEFVELSYRRGPADQHIIRAVDGPAFSVHIYDKR